MADRTFLDWPFFDDRHRALAAELETWCEENLPVDHTDIDAACTGLVRTLGAGGWLRHTGAKVGETLDVRTLCLIRETLARHDGLADFSFAMQGLGMGAVSLFGTPKQRRRLLVVTISIVRFFGVMLGFRLSGAASVVCALSEALRRCPSLKILPTSRPSIRCCSRCSPTASNRSSGK